MEPCEICLIRPATDWDHDHASGFIRGRLCNQCNSGMGLMGDSPDLLRRAAAYLEKPLSDTAFAEVQREKMRLAMQRWRAAHREEERARVRAAYAADPERFREYSRRWRRDDADGTKKRQRYEAQRQWLLDNPDKREEYNANRREAQRLDRLEQYRAKYRRNMADPEKKAKERARIRDYKRQQRAKEKT